MGHRGSSDLALLWLWCRPAATDPIRLLSWKPPYAAGVDLKSKKRKRERERELNTPEQEVNVYEVG